MKRIATIVICLVLLLAAFPLGAMPSVYAESVDTLSEKELKETFGLVSSFKLVGTANYKKARQAYTEINAARTKAGKSQLKLDGALTKAAMQRAAECAVLFSALRPDCSDYTTVLSGKGVYAQCIATNSPSAEEIVAAWMGSATDKAVILDKNNKKFRSIGIGAFKAANTYYWCLLVSSQDRQEKLTYTTAKNNVSFTISFRTKVVPMFANIETEEMQMAEGETFDLNISLVNMLFPVEEIPVGSGIKFESKDTSVAKIDQKGNITTVKSGNTVITVRGGNDRALLEIPLTVTGTELRACMSTTDAGTPKIIWSPVTGSTIYKVYRKVCKDGEWSDYSLYRSTKELYVVDGHIKPGAQAKYVVYAYKDDERIAKDTLDTLYLTKPKVMAYNVAEGVKISWNAVVGASYYTVYRRTYSKSSGWSSPTLYKTTKELTYTDTKAKDGQKVQYHVYAHKGDYKSAYGRYIITFLAPPKVTVTNSAKGIKVTWTSTKAATYTVSRSVYKDGKWGSEYSRGDMRDIRGTTYTDTRPTSGQKVRYYVSGYKDECFSGDSVVQTIMHLDQPNVKLTKATQGVKATWKKVGGATYYKVYKSVYKNGKWTEYTAYKETKSTSFTDKSVKRGANVRYTVYAVNGTYKSAYKTGVSIKR